jgi:hypothetical protein
MQKILASLRTPLAHSIHYTASALLALLLNISPAIAFAQDSANSGDLLCAAIVPCNPDGTVFEPYNQGACAAVYARQCARKVEELDPQSEAEGKQYQQLLEQELISCQKDSLASQNKLRKQLRQLRRSLR